MTECTFQPFASESGFPWGFLKEGSPRVRRNRLWKRPYSSGWAMCAYGSRQCFESTSVATFQGGSTERGQDYLSSRFSICKGFPVETATSKLGSKNPTA